MGEIRVGTSGWSYPSGRGTWNGVFYPEKRARPKGFDELRFYAEHFDTVEINSTFYRPPAPETARSWATKTPPGFEFSVKLYQKFTHPEMFLKATGADPHDLGQKDVEEFTSGIAPIAEAGKLGALLAQFPVSFRKDANTREYLAWVLDTFREYPIAVELRHRTWSDTLEATLGLLNAHHAAWVQIDEPKFRFSVRQNRLPNVGDIYYMRLHGRNAAKWWKHDKSEDRYDYLYSPAELKPFAETATAVRTIVRKAYLYLNNHFAAKAVADAVELKHQMGEPITGGYRPELVAAYPFLAHIPECAAEKSLFPPRG